MDLTLEGKIESYNASRLFWTVSEIVFMTVITHAVDSISVITERAVTLEALSHKRAEWPGIKSCSAEQSCNWCNNKAPIISAIWLLLHTKIPTTRSLRFSSFDETEPFRYPSCIICTQFCRISSLELGCFIFSHWRFSAEFKLNCIHNLVQLGQHGANEQGQ